LVKPSLFLMTKGYISVDAQIVGEGRNRIDVLKKLETKRRKYRRVNSLCLTVNLCSLRFDEFSGSRSGPADLLLAVHENRLDPTC
jgi:hypothetical protein